MTPGDKYGRLTAVKVHSTGYCRSHDRWEFMCECGNKKVANANNVKQGGVRSCGCLKKEHIDKIRGLRLRRIQHEI